MVNEYIDVNCCKIPNFKVGQNHQLICLLLNDAYVKKNVCRFEDDTNISSQFEELWEEYTSGERITLNLYLGEIVSLICDGMSSSSWARKKKVSCEFCHLFSPCSYVDLNLVICV